MLLLAPARAAAGPGGMGSTVAPASPRIDPGELRGLLHQIVAAGAPGAAARIRDEHGVTQAASGVADLRNGRPMRPGLHYRVGSLTKPFVATVVLQLVAEGRVSLQDTVERWLPGILPYGDQVTVRQLLSHTSGVPDYTLEPIVRLYTDPQARFRAWTPRELVALIADQPPDFPPGTAWSYSNTGYVLAGMIVEAATGHRLGRELTRRILRPLGLRNTVFPVNRPTIPGRTRAATASTRLANRTARCWTSPSSTRHWPGRRARWCPTLATWSASSVPCWVAGCCRPGCWPR